MKRNTLNIGITLVLCMLTGCTALEEINTQIEAEQNAEAQRRAESKRRLEEHRIAAGKRRDEEMHRRDEESASEWYDRVEQIIRAEYDAAKKRSYDRTYRAGRRNNRNSKDNSARKRYDDEMKRFGEMFVTELKREAHRKSGENLDMWKQRIEKLLPEMPTRTTFPNYSEQVRWETLCRLISEVKKAVDEEVTAENNRERIQHAEKLLLQTEKELNDPAFKYPYSKNIAGVELYDGYLSGLSCKWVAISNFIPDIKRVTGGNSVYNGDIAADLAKAKQTVRGVILHKNVAFYFDKRYGTLHSVSFDVNGGSESVTKKIEEYKKKYPGLKHIRKTQRDGRIFNKFPVSYKCVWDIRTDTLESKRMKIVIVSQSLIGLENFVILSNQLSDLQKNEVKEMHKKTMRDGLEKNAVITITDKVLKEYFASLESTPTAK